VISGLRMGKTQVDAALYVMGAAPLYRRACRFPTIGQSSTGPGENYWPVANVNGRRRLANGSVRSHQSGPVPVVQCRGPLHQSRQLAPLRTVGGAICVHHRG
jgi:hypothetical protein